jgi:hypothetical protein
VAAAPEGVQETRGGRIDKVTGAIFGTAVGDARGQGPLPLFWPGPVPGTCSSSSWSWRTPSGG